MKKVTIKMDIKGSAFDVDYPEREVAIMLKAVADKIASGKTEFKIMDINGNSCGTVKIV